MPPVNVLSPTLGLNKSIADTRKTLDDLLLQLARLALCEEVSGDSADHQGDDSDYPCFVLFHVLLPTVPVPRGVSTLYMD